MVTGRKDVDVSQRNNGYRQTVKTQQNSSIKAKNNLQTQETGKPKETHTQTHQGKTFGNYKQENLSTSMTNDTAWE